MIKHLLFIVAGCLMLVASAGAWQDKFDVASVKPNTSGRVLPSLPLLTAGRVAITNVGLRQLINLSHGVQPLQLEGLPSWAESARFDINATSRDNATTNDLLTMVRSLLIERFQLVTRRDTRQMDIYTLGADGARIVEAASVGGGLRGGGQRADRGRWAPSRWSRAAVSDSPDDRAGPRHCHRRPSEQSHQYLDERRRAPGP